MRVLVALFAAFACVVAQPAAVNYAYSAIAPWSGYQPYAAAWNPWAYSGAWNPLAYRAAPAILPAAAPWAPAIAPLGIQSQYHAQDELGQASYGHAEPGQTHNTVQDAFGNRVGSFSYVNPEGKLVQTSYVADAAGYRVASNDLPVAPVDNSVAPAPVADTPEVAAARAAHLAEVEAAKSRSRRSAVVTPADTTPIAAAPLALPIAPLAHPYAAWPYAHLPYAAPYLHAYPTTNTVPVVTGPNGYLADTPEVAAAKANHFAEHAAARARVGAYYY